MTREEAIWWVNHLFEIRKEEYFNKGMMKDAKEVEEAQTTVLKALSDEAGWIPVGERLPNTNGIFIVTRRRSDGFECRNITDACYFDGSSTWHDDTRVNHERKYLADVLAWMPLPEPYRDDYGLATEQMEHDAMYEPTYNSEDGSL